jgi:hypothetical protein
LTVEKHRVNNTCLLAFHQLTRDAIRVEPADSQKNVFVELFSSNVVVNSNQKFVINLNDYLNTDYSWQS